MINKETNLDNEIEKQMDHPGHEKNTWRKKSPFYKYTVPYTVSTVQTSQTLVLYELGSSYELNSTKGFLLRI